MNHFWQIAYKVAYQFARCYWYVARPTARGAYVAVWVDGCVLVIRNSYKRVYSLPSGGIDANESARAAAARELREEVGIAVDESRLTEVGQYECFGEFKHDTTTVFEIHLTDEPAIQVDHREVVLAEFMPLKDALKLPLSETADRYLNSVLANPGMKPVQPDPCLC